MTSYYGLTTVLDTDTINITQSDLAAFKRDRRVWLLKTYLGIRPRIDNVIGPLELGTMVHAALEANYKHGEDMLPWYMQHAKKLGEYYAATIPHFDQHAWNKQVEMGRVMLEGYEQWIDADNLDARYETVDVEKLLRIVTSYHGLRVSLSGKADLIVRDRATGELLVFDWKTTANIARTVRQAHTTEQLPYYMTLLQALEPASMVGGAAFNILLKTKRTERAKPPFYVREHVRFDARALAVRQAGIDGTIADYVRTVDALNNGVAEPLRVAYPNPSVPSYDRDLDTLIDVMDTGGNVAGVIASQYKQIDPYSRYAEPESPMLAED